MRFPTVHSSVGHRAKLAATWAGRGIFKGMALVAAFVLIVAIWFWDAAILTQMADRNLWIVKTVTGALPGEWSSRVESALRVFGADRALLLTEAVLLAKIVMIALAYPFTLLGRRIRRRWRGGTRGAESRAAITGPQNAAAPAGPDHSSLRSSVFRTLP